IRLLPNGVFPETRWVKGSNFCDIGFKLDTRTNRLIMGGAIDNLVKGASGQAVQNMNIMFGLPEQTGIDAIPLFPA
ncbi:MAG: N-acetyl-gamma-glutamyl-phosphate reductase, partial [Spirochaetales bacterium]|nr:N-acetyl-gamma-glutamyl-phosphate reductase [Spirochaetales bacterium]